MKCCWAEAWVLGYSVGWLLEWERYCGMPDLALLQLPGYLHMKPCDCSIDPTSGDKIFSNRKINEASPQHSGSAKHELGPDSVETSLLLCKNFNTYQFPGLI